MPSFEVQLNGSPVASLIVGEANTIATVSVTSVGRADETAVQRQASGGTMLRLHAMRSTNDHDLHTTVWQEVPLSAGDELRVKFNAENRQFGVAEEPEKPQEQVDHCVGDAPDDRSFAGALERLIEAESYLPDGGVADGDAAALRTQLHGLKKRLQALSRDTDGKR